MAQTGALPVSPRYPPVSTQEQTDTRADTASIHSRGSRILPDDDQDADASPATTGSPGGGAPRQAAGPVPARDRAGTGHSLQYRASPCPDMGSAGLSPSRRAQRTGTGISDPIRRLTFALDNDAIDGGARSVARGVERRGVPANTERAGGNPAPVCGRETAGVLTGPYPPTAGRGGPPSGQQQLGEVCSEVGICKGTALKISTGAATLPLDIVHSIEADPVGCGPYHCRSPYDRYGI